LGLFCPEGRGRHLGEAQNRALEQIQAAHVRAHPKLGAAPSLTRVFRLNIFANALKKKVKMTLNEMFILNKMF